MRRRIPFVLTMFLLYVHSTITSSNQHFQNKPHNLQISLFEDGTVVRTWQSHDNNNNNNNNNLITEPRVVFQKKGTIAEQHSNFTSYTQTYRLPAIYHGFRQQDGTILYSRTYQITESEKVKIIYNYEKYHVEQCRNCIIFIMTYPKKL